MLPWPVNSPEGLASVAGGGSAAKSYGGRTAVQEAVNVYQQSRGSFSLFRSVARPDIVRVGATSAVNAAAIYGAWHAGLYVGSIASQLISGDECQ